MGETIYIAIGFIIGWWVRGKAFDLAMDLCVRIIVSDIGKKRVLEALQRGVEKLASNTKADRENM